MNMKKAIIAILLGTIVYHGWSMASWMALPLHDKSIKTIPEEQLITDTLKTVITQPGFYSFPGWRNADGSKVPMEDFKQKCLKGPIGSIVFIPGGKECMPAKTIVIGLINSLLISILGFIILWAARGSIQGILLRGVFLGAVGVLVWLAAWLPAWNWMSYPCDYIAPYLVDLVVGFGLIGLVQAKFVSE